MSNIVAAPRTTSGWRTAGAVLAAVALAASWMLLSLFVGRAGLGKALTSETAGQATLSQALTRMGVTGAATKVQVMFATPEFYERTGQTAAAAEAEPGKYLVFIVTEENHDKLKPAPVPSLAANGRRLSVPMKDRLLSASDHHRTRMIRFLRTGMDGTPYLPDGTRRLELVWPGVRQVHRPDHSLGNPLSWAWPLQLSQASAAAPGVTPASFLLLTAGLFAALSPCLIQLTLYYLSSLAGTTTVPGASRRSVLLTAAMFVAGISAAYTLGGVLAGYVGRAVQVGNVLGAYGRWVAAGSGLVIILMGLRTVIQSEAPLVCHMRLPGAGRLSRWQSSAAAPFLMGFLMSLGCLQCFGGALFASLLVYVGSLGSPGLGALMLFLFSLGVAVPFLAAALAWRSVTEWLAGTGRLVRHVAFASGVMMMAFGILMLVDKFHWISGIMLRWMPFLQA